MPQPLRRWLDDITFSVTAVTERPTLAVGIAGVAAAWANIEIALGLLLAVILHTEARTGVSMYLALRGSAAQDAALVAAAEARLPEHLRLEFTSLLRTIRKRGKERNQVVQGLWGISPQLPDILINCQPENFVRDVANSYNLYLLSGAGGTPNEAFARNLLTYDSRDFLAIMARLIEANGAIGEFTRKVGEAHKQRLALARALMPPPPTAEAAAPPEENQTNPSERA